MHFAKKYLGLAAVLSFANFAFASEGEGVAPAAAKLADFGDGWAITNSMATGWAVSALIVGLMIVRMGWRYGWGSLNDLMDHAVDQEEVDAIRATLAATDGVAGVHDVRTRKMGDMVLVDAHIEVDATLSVDAGHAIAVAAREQVMQQHHRVLNVMTHVDPWRAAAR